MILKAVRSERLCSAKHRVIGAIWITVLSSGLVGDFFEREENMRFRFDVEPLVIITAATFASDLARWSRPRLRWRTRPNPEAGGE